MDSNTIELCKCCGAVIPPPVNLSTLMMRIYKFISTHPNCTINDLVKELYDGAIDGGPIDPKHALRQHIRKTRDKLAKYGVTIACSSEHLYRLERLSA